MPAVSESEPHVSIVVPVYNEAQRLPRSVRAMAAHFSRWEFPHEILIVVEHSTDGTLDLALQTTAKQANFRVIDNGIHRGKGYAVRSGVQRARGAFIFYMDVDLSVPLDEIDPFLKHFDQHPEHDVLVGDRRHPDSQIVRSQSLVRRKMGRVFNRTIRALSLLDIRDTQCGFKAFRQRAARDIFGRQSIDGFAFDVEVLMLAHRLGYGIADLPVRWVNSPQSTVHIVRDSARMLLDTVTVRQRVDRALHGGNGT